MGRGFHYIKICFAAILMACVQLVFASGSYSSFTINHLQGLSNSAVLSILQDNQGLMWFGTYDGLNCYDGRTIEVFRTDFSKGRTLDNNIISRIQIAADDKLWVQSFSGVNLFSTDSLSVIDNYIFPDEETIVFSNRKGNSWIVGKRNIYYYNVRHRCFVKAGKMNFHLDNLQQSAFVDEKGELHIVPVNDTKMYHFSLNSFSTDSLQTNLQVTSSLLHSKPIKKTFIQSEVICFIDSADDLYLYDASKKSKVYIRNVGELLRKYGSFMNVFPFYDDVLITLHTGGILRLMASQQYQEDLMRVDLRIFSAYTDSQQGILWMGTDGAGVVKFAKKDALVTNLMLSRMSPSISGQVRGIMTDHYGTLWIGTKGDGLIRIPNYQKELDINSLLIYSPKGKWALSEYVRGPNFYPVFMLKKKNHGDDFWVGMSDSLLYYYSYQSDKLVPVQGSIKYSTEIHGLYEENDSVLWLATLGTGLIKVVLDVSHDVPQIKRFRRFRCFAEQKEIVEYSSLWVQGDSVLWMGSRGQGLVRFDIRKNEYQVYSLRAMLGKAVNDVLCLCEYDKSHVFVGTTAGLVSVQVNGRNIVPSYIGREQGLVNEMVHGIVKDDAGILWMGTNKGMIKYDPVSGGSYTYYYSKGIEIGEFSDDSYYRSPYNGDIFLGGVDGLLYMNDRQSSIPEYYPKLVLRKLIIDREEVNLNRYYSDDKKIIVLPEGQNTFSLQFVALDYLNADIEYAYILEGYDEKWSLFSKENEAVFKDVPPGKYVFRVRYKKDVLDTVYEEYSVVIKIVPFWYHTIWAYLGISLFIILCLSGYVYRLYRKGFFSRLARAWAISGRGLEEIRLEENLSMKEKALGSWSAYFPYCIEFEQITFIQRILEIIEANLDKEELGPTFLAEKMHISPRQFYRKFKDLSGIAPSDFIKKYRMDKAAQLLSDTDMSIQEVIESVGISSRPYFYKEFADKYGTTPKNYRAQHKGAASAN